MSEELKVQKDNFMLVDYNSLMTIRDEAYKTLGLDKSREIREEIELMIAKLAYFQVENQTLPIKEFLIKIESPTAKFLIDTPSRRVDAYITYENVVAAYLNAITTADNKMANKIEPLLKKRVFGFTNEIQDEYEYGVLEYIKENGNLQSFLEGKRQIKRVKNIYPIEDSECDEYIVYEDGNCFIAKINNSASLKRRM